MELKLEVVVIPVADVDRALAFYTGIGFLEDADFRTERGLRVVQVTPPGSAASIIFGEQLTDVPPGTVRGLHLVTADIAGARAELAERGVAISGLWHDADGVFHWAGGANRVPGAHPEAESYGTFASFEDPDGNEWILQQVVTRAPGR
ncbi:VOC family protein [Mycetocola sp. JXN-3]|uniref:VOC family protein n=1 Tax=Mycetocola sp. JXN-3 TaxID=2116510 RepID=UPI00165CF255|nr:VOC family protein [Mycetocola sp. JXN-3]